MGTGYVTWSHLRETGLLSAQVNHITECALMFIDPVVLELTDIYTVPSNQDGHSFRNHQVSWNLFSVCP